LILALAGLDYSHLKEPDWLPDSSRQPQHVMEIIRQTVDQVRKLWDQRQQVDLRQIFGTGEFFTRQRPIYYDTDQIVEKQHEQIRLCTECSGWRVIVSEALKSYQVPVKIAVVIVPWLACNSCRVSAMARYRQLTAEADFDHVFYQDCERELFLRA